MRAVALFLREIRLEHTLFALPFAYVGAILAAHGLPTPAQLGWITLAVLGARTAAMAANRFLDREIDARNPRTARRALASGTLPSSTMLWATVAGLSILLWAAWMLNPLCLKLLPIAVVLLLIYPLCKRFTWLTHFVLGAVDGLAPLGAYVAIAGKITLPALALFAAVTIWVAGFDIVYALMDLSVDREQGISSLPVRFGERSGRFVPILLHLPCSRCSPRPDSSTAPAGRTISASPPWGFSSCMKSISFAAAPICSSSTNGSFARTWRFRSSSC